MALGGTCRLLFNMNREILTSNNNSDDNMNYSGRNLIWFGKFSEKTARLMRRNATFRWLKTSNKLNRAQPQCHLHFLHKQCISVHCSTHSKGWSVKVSPNVWGGSKRPEATDNLQLGGMLQNRATWPCSSKTCFHVSWSHLRQSSMR